MDDVAKARRELTAKGYERFSGDVNSLDYSTYSRADVLLPGGRREAWVKLK